MISFKTQVELFLYPSFFSLELIDQMDAQRALVLYSRAADKGKTDGQVHSNIFMREIRVFV